MLKDIKVQLNDRSYDVVIFSGAIRSVFEDQDKKGRRYLLVTNKKIYNLYGKDLLEVARTSSIDIDTLLISDGERYKNVSTVGKIYDKLIRNRYDRSSVLIALGGGVIGDITGFAAATFMRGIDYISIPTTLLSQIDSSVGGKTGVNHKLGKNLIGSFHHPKLVVSDLLTLKSLPKRELLAGIAELIKYAFIMDSGFYRYLDTNINKILDLSDKELGYAVHRSVVNKAKIVKIDEKEKGVRAYLNFGHTLGHAIEAVTDYKVYKHGEAISIGMVFAARLSNLRSLLGSRETEKVIDLIKRAKLPFKIDKKLKTDDLVSAMMQDKKILKGKLTFVLLNKIGSATIDREAPIDLVREAISACR